MTTPMADADWLKLLTWLSPAFPVGGYAWSGGLEAACDDGSVHDTQSLQTWLSTSLHHGFMRQDAILLGAAWEQSDDPNEVNDLALALSGSAQRYHETTSLGSGFVEAAKSWRSNGTKLPDPIAYPVAVGTVAREHNIAKAQAITAYLHAATSAQIQAALRLFPLGQTNAMAVQHAIEDQISQTATFAASATLDDLGSAAIMMDIAAMKHETLPSRIFRS